MSVDVKGVRIKLRPDSISKAKEWAEHINSGKAEVLSILRNEGINLEAVFLDHVAGNDYLIYIMKGDLEKSKAVAAASKYPMDIYHAQFKKHCWESRAEMEPLIWLEPEDL
jgi:hypothetical protein